VTSPHWHTERTHMGAVSAYAGCHVYKSLRGAVALQEVCSNNLMAVFHLKCTEGC